MRLIESFRRLLRPEPEQEPVQASLEKRPPSGPLPCRMTPSIRPRPCYPMAEEIATGGGCPSG